MGEEGSWQRGVRGSPGSPCSNPNPETMSGDNEDAHSPEESPTEEKVRFIAPWISSNMSAVDIVLALRSV